MRRFLYAALLALILPAAHANAKDDAVRAAAEDCITTGAGLAFGLAEGNPAGPLVSCALKGAFVGIASDMSEPDRTQLLHGAHAVWGGAAVNNVMALVGAGVAAPVFGIMVAIGLWASGEDEREFMKACAIHEKLAGRKLTCEFKHA